MKPVNIDVNIEVGKSFSAWKIEDPAFVVPWHKHDEMELLFIEKGFGTRFVGDHIEQFKDGDLVMLGSKVPHFWKSDAIFDEREDLTITAYCLTFNKSLLGDLIRLPEFHKINLLFRNAESGLCFPGIPLHKLSKKFDKMIEARDADRFSHLIAMLQYLSEKEQKSLISPGYSNQYDAGADKRISNVFEYITQNFKKNILLEEVADIANMSTNAFSRFFKAQTHKTFSQFLNETRVGYACKLLIDDNLSITQIAYNSGFPNHSNFDKQFKKIVGKTPRQYKNEYIN